MGEGLLIRNVGILLPVARGAVDWRESKQLRQHSVVSGLSGSPCYSPDIPKRIKVGELRDIG
jgi:hypothetical protein